MEHGFGIKTGGLSYEDYLLSSSKYNGDKLLTKEEYKDIAFLFFKGIFSKQYQLTALAFVVVFLYGSLLWYLFPIDPKISWEGHLSGFAVGFVFALLFRSNPIAKRKYAWEEEDFDPDADPFLRHFDEEGNFIEQLPEEEEEIEKTPRKIVIRYTYRKSKDADKENGD